MKHHHNAARFNARDHFVNWMKLLYIDLVDAVLFVERTRMELGKIMVYIPDASKQGIQM